MHTLVVEDIVGGTEELLVRRAAVQRGIVLAGHEAHVLDLELADDGLELSQTPTPLDGVVGGVRQVAREDDEVGRFLQLVDRGDRLAQRDIGIGVGRTLETPMRVRELNEIELTIAASCRRAAGEPGGEDDTAACGGQVQEISAFHGLSPLK